MSIITEQHDWYNAVMSSDIDVAPDLLSTTGELHPELVHRMTHSDELDCGVYNVSFGEYMNQFGQRGADLYVLTANSAIPVADSIRGWYDEMGGDIPPMAYIRANRKLSSPTRPRTAMQQRLIERESVRFQANYAGARAVIIDQYCFSGGTIALARSILEQAGVTVVGSTSEAKWYNQASGKINYRDITSEHASAMRHIGRDAVRCQSADYLAELYGDADYYPQRKL